MIYLVQPQINRMLFLLPDPPIIRSACGYNRQPRITNIYIHSPATLLGTPVQLLVTQIAHQPITWQQLNAIRHLDVVKMICWSPNRASESGKKGYLSDFDRGMIVGARRAGLSFSKTADLLGFSRTTISRVYR